MFMLLLLVIITHKEGLTVKKLQHLDQKRHVFPQLSLVSFTNVKPLLLLLLRVSFVVQHAPHDRIFIGIVAPEEARRHFT